MADQETPPLSRRDFLRRASKEAADTGTRLLPVIPGGALAKTVLGIGETTAAPTVETGGDNTAAAASSPTLPKWLRAVVAWRAKTPKGDDA